MPIWLWGEIDMGRNCYGPKCPVTSSVIDQDLSQSVASPNANPGGVSLILAEAHTFVEIDHEKYLWSFSSCWFKKGCCQLVQVKVCARRAV